MHPATAGRHEYKIGALGKTIAVPVQPGLFLSDLRIVRGPGSRAMVGVVDALAARRVRAGP